MRSDSFRKLRHDATAQILVDAAEAVLIAKGLEKVTMRDIAAQAGCAAGTIYLYFKNKQDVIGAIADRHSGTLLSQVTPLLGDSALLPLERLRRVTFAMVEYFSMHRAIIRILQAGGVTGLSSLPEECQERWRRFMAEELKAIRAAQADGSVRNDFPPEVIQQFRAMVISGFNSDVQGDVPPASPDVQAQRVWGGMTGGICGKGGRA